MEVIRGPKYPEGNVRECDVCLCQFKFFNNEICHESYNVLPFLSGTGYCVYVVCPVCGKHNILHSKFIEENKIVIEKEESNGEIYGKKIYRQGSNRNSSC